jgi:ribosomal protein S18 acetylase RimI-like enzyme
MAEPKTVTVCRLAAEDWTAYRGIRLAMLAESPSAFGGTHAQAAGYDEQLWRQRLADNHVFLARVGGTSAGSAMYSEYGITDPADSALYGMWVDPEFRRAGVGWALVDAVIEQARAAGKRRLILDVAESNQGAQAFYERCGFVATGHTSPYPNDHRLTEFEMELVF